MVIIATSIDKLKKNHVDFAIKLFNKIALTLSKKSVLDKMPP